MTATFTCGCLLAIGARAATVDTFSFIQTGWANAPNVGNVTSAGVPDPGGTLAGNFTGVVEPGGLMQLNDLSLFSALFTDNSHPAGLDGTGMNLSSLTVFSYLTDGGPGSLNIAPALFVGGDCVGGAVPFSPACTFNFGFSYAPGIFGAVFVAVDPFPFFVTMQQPVITLLSSVTTPPPVPEPSSLSLLAVFGLLGLAARRARLRTAPNELAGS